MSPKESSFNIHQSGQTLEVKFAEAIDENCDFSSINLTQSEEVLFNFRNVMLINSIGVKRLIDLFNKVPKDKLLHLIDCPVVLVNQMNIFPSLLSGRRVKVMSFAIPYYCESCDASSDIIVSEAPKGVAPPMKCQSCGSEMELDEVQDVYFSFLDRIKST